MDKVPTAHECMSQVSLYFHPEDDMLKAIDALVSKGLSGAPVIDEQHQLLGILTEKDCLRFISNAAYDDLEAGTVADYMSSAKGVVERHMDMFAVACLFLSTNFVTLPVVEEGKLIGHINRRDVLENIRIWQRRHMQEKIHDLQVSEQSQKAPSSIEELQKMVGSQKKEQIIAILKQSRE